MKKSLTKKEDLDLYMQITIVLLAVVVGGIFGFIYETIFYRIDLGYFVKRGAGIGPWIPIYSFGTLFITLLTRKFKDKPFLVFLISSCVCGLLEFIVGYLLYHLKNIRLWDYNTEIWNFGNINGYICLRSVLFFGISGLFLVYFIIPTLKKIAIKTNRTIFLSIVLILFVLFSIDIITHYLIL